MWLWPSPSLLSLGHSNESGHGDENRQQRHPVFFQPAHAITSSLRVVGFYHRSGQSLNKNSRSIPWKKESRIAFASLMVKGYRPATLSVAVLVDFPMTRPMSDVPILRRVISAFKFWSISSPPSTVRGGLWLYITTAHGGCQEENPPYTEIFFLRFIVRYGMV